MNTRANEPFVTLNLCDTQVVQALKDAGFYDTVMEQMQRVQPGPNNLFTIQFASGQDRVLHFATYHCKVGDSGWTMISIYNPTPEIVAHIEEILADCYNSPIKVLYVDDPKRRN